MSDSATLRAALEERMDELYLSARKMTKRGGGRTWPVDSPEDLLHDAVVTVMLKADSYEDGTNVVAWVVQVMAWKRIDAVRMQETHRCPHGHVGADRARRAESWPRVKDCPEYNGNPPRRYREGQDE